MRLEIDQEPLRRPWGVRVDFLLSSHQTLGIEGQACILSGPDAIIQIGPAPEQPRGEHAHLKRFRVQMEGFVGPCEAESAGLALSQALLWVAISRRFPLRLDYHTPLPAIVYDRTAATGGLRASGYATLTVTMGASGFADILGSSLPLHSGEVDRLLLLSMELFAAARLEFSERSKFVTLVSALEPFAQPHSYPASVGSLMEDFLSQLKDAKLSDVSEGEVKQLKNSLAGRIRALKHESIRQALLRTVRDLLPEDQESVTAIDEAYALRSNILHEGYTDPYLDKRIASVEGVMRRLFAARLGRPLDVPA